MATDKVPVARSASTTAYSATMAEIATWANTNLPVASTTVSGTVKVDGTSITIASGVISSAAAPPASTSPPAMDGTANAGVLNQWSRGDHIHPSDTTRVTQAQGDARWLQLSGGTTTGPVALASGSTTTTVTPASDSTTKLATTAFVQSALGAAGAGVSSWNTRAGAVTLQQSDLAALNVYDDAGRNLLHNGLFNVAQRGAGGWSTSGAYTADRWQLVFANGTATVSLAAQSDAARAQIGDENSTQTLNANFAGGAGAGDLTLLQQAIEGVRRLAGKTVTVSFYAAGSAAGQKVGVGLTQNFGTGGSPSAGVDATGVLVNLTSGTTWARYSATLTIPSASGKTLGTNGNDCTLLRLWLSAGSTYAAASGGVGQQTANLWFWGVQLEVGTQATPLDYGGSPQQVLAQCQRFFYAAQAYSAGYAGGNIGLAVSLTLPVTMRATPTIAITSNSDSAITSPTQGAIAGGVYFGGTAPAAAGPWVINRMFTASADL